MQFNNSIGKKLAIAFGVLVSLIAISHLLIHKQSRILFKNIHLLADIQIPAEQATLEMEINTLETAQAVTLYLEKSDQKLREKIKDSEGDFERYHEKAIKLFSSDRGKKLLNQVKMLYKKFFRLGKSLINMEDEIEKSLEIHAKNTRMMDEIQDNQLQPLAIESKQIRKIELAMEHEINTDEMSLHLRRFLQFGLEPSKEKYFDSEGDFEKHQAAYFRLNLTDAEKLTADRQRTLYEKNKLHARRIVDLKETMSLEFRKFSDYLEQIDHILDVELQELAFSNTRQARENSAQASERLNLFLWGVLLLSIFLGLSTAYLISKNISKRLGKLIVGTEKFILLSNALTTTLIIPPLLPCFSSMASLALVIRFVNTCSSLVMSPITRGSSWHRSFSTMSAMEKRRSGLSELNSPLFSRKSQMGTMDWQLIS